MTKFDELLASAQNRGDDKTAAELQRLHERMTELTSSQPDRPKPEIYFDSGRRLYLWRSPDTGRLCELNESQVRAVLHRVHGLFPKADTKGGESQIDKELRETFCYRSVDAVCPLAGYTGGVHVLGDTTVLVPNHVDELPKEEGEFPIIHGIMERAFKFDDTPQLDVIYTWMKLYLQALRKQWRQTGQMLVLAGPKSAGKSTMVQTVIAPLFTGRVGFTPSPFNWMMKATRFNDNLAGARLLVIDDEDTKNLDVRAKNALHSAIKKLVASPTMDIEGKYKKPFTIERFNRLVATVNDEPDQLRMIPAMDESCQDKVIVLKVAPIPESSVAYGEKWHEMQAAIQLELPKFRRWLEDEYNPPNGLLTGRHGLVSYKHPALIQQFEHDDWAIHMLQMFVDAVAISDEEVQVRRNLSVAELLEAIQVSDRRATTRTVGLRFTELAERYPLVVQKHRTRTGLIRYDINTELAVGLVNPETGR